MSSKHDIRAAKKAKEDREALAAKQDADQRGKSRADCLKELVESGLLTKLKGESVMGALKRLGDEKKRLTKDVRQQKQKKSESMDTDNNSDRIKEASSKIDQLTSLASLLLDAYGETDIYDETYDGVVKTLRLEGEVPRVCLIQCHFQTVM